MEAGEQYALMMSQCVDLPAGAAAITDILYTSERRTTRAWRMKERKAHM